MGLKAQVKIIEHGKIYVRNNISPKVTRFYAKIGFADRNVLANNLHQLSPLTGFADELAVINSLEKNGILKPRFDVKNLQEIQPFMLKAVTPSKVEALFPGSEAIMKNIADGTEAGLSTVTREVLSSEVGSVKPATLAMIGGLGTATVIGATVIGIPMVPLVLGVSTVYGLVSTVMINKVKDPRSLEGKIFKFGTRVLPLAIAGYMTTAIFSTFQSGGMFNDAINGFVKDLVVYGTGAAAVGYVALTATDIRRAIKTNNAALRPILKETITRDIMLANGLVFSKSIYMSYRAITTMAFALGAVSFHFSALPMMLLLAAGISARFALPWLVDHVKLSPEKMANGFEKVNDKWLSRTIKKITLSNGRTVTFTARKDSSGLINIVVNNGETEKIFAQKEGAGLGDLLDQILVKDKICKKPLKNDKGIVKEINDDDVFRLEDAIQLVYDRASSKWRLHYTQLDKVAVESVLSLAVKWMPLLALTVPFAASPLQLFFDLATVYTGLWALNADLHSSINPIGSALNAKRSNFNIEDPYISDAFKNKIDAFCARMCAYVAKENERNINKIINTLIMEYAHTEVDSCSETDPRINIDNVRSLFVAQKVINMVKAWQADIYKMFNSAYNELLPAKEKATPADVRKAAEELARRLETLGRSFYPEEKEKKDPKAKEECPSEDKEQSKDNGQDLAEGKERDHSYYKEIKELMKKDKEDADEKKKSELMFNLKDEEPYTRQTFDALKIRGFILLEMARNIREMIKADEATYERIEFLYREMMGVYSVRSNHFIRRFEWLDDKDKTKTSNLSTPETHRGDTLYQIWVIDSLAGRKDFKGHYVPSTLVRLDNPDFNHREGVPRYIWIKREDFMDVLGVSGSMSSEYQFVENTPAGAQFTDIQLAEFAEFPSMKVRGFYSDKEILESRGLIDWKGKHINKSNVVWIAGDDAPHGFKTAFREWAKVNYGKSYEKWSEQNKALWYIEKPQVFVFAPAENYNISDENYIVINSERQLQAELKHEAEKNKIIRVVDYEEHLAEFPNPGLNREHPESSRPVENVRSWSREDAAIGIRVTTKNGEQYDLPYDEERESFVKGLAYKEDWRNISYGLIRTDDAGKSYIEVYSKDNRKQGVVQTEWPIHMPPVSEIKTYGEKNLPRIEFDVFPERVGKTTWLIADYGDDYLDKKRAEEDPDDLQLYNVRRYARLDFDREAKQEFWQEFIRSIDISKDGRRIVFKTISPLCMTFPFFKAWAGIKWSKEADVLEVDSSGEIYMSKDDRSWSPKRDESHTEKVNGGIMLIKGKDGTEKVVSIPELPSSLSDPKEARRVLKVEKSNDGKVLTFIKMRSHDHVKDNPGYIYSLPRDLYDSYNAENSVPAEKLPYVKLKWMLDEKDVTAGFDASKTDGIDDIYICDENGREIEGIRFSSRNLTDNEGMGFLKNPASNMGSPDSFYRSNNNTYSGTEEFRPRFMKADGEIKLLLTRVEKVKMQTPEYIAWTINGADHPDMFFAIPTSAVKILTKDGREIWTPLSLSKPIPKNYRETPNLGRVAVKDGENRTRYSYMPVSKDIPEGTSIIKYKNDEGKFVAIELEVNTESFAQQNCIVKESDVSADAERGILAALGIKDIKELKGKDVSIEVTNTWSPDIIDGEYQSVVHGQRQHGTQYKKETFPATEQAQFRDEYFYGVVNECFSEAFPADGEPRSPSLQRGKTHDYDRNGKYSGKPIENGTQFVGGYRHLAEMVAITQGLPKKSAIAIASVLDRSGGYRQSSHKPKFKKLEIYCREKGWLSGVSEDEQGVLALSLALGYNLKYHVRLTGFESQPTTWGQVNKQDNARYNTAMALAEDVLKPYELRQIRNWFLGKEINGTWKQKLEHLLFRLWYEWPKAELSRQLAPVVFMASDGRVKPYIIDPFFIFSYVLDFGMGTAFYANFRRELGRNRGSTGKGSFEWSFIDGPAMNQSFFFSALAGDLELFRKGWQYGSFVTTALQKSDSVPLENKKMLDYLINSQTLATIWGVWRTLPINALFGSPGDAFISSGYLLNEFWAAYAVMINLRAKRYMAECEGEDPDRSKIDKKSVAFTVNRERAFQDTDKKFDEYADMFMEAYSYSRSGKHEEAKEILRKIVSDNDVNKDHNFSGLAEVELQKHGMTKEEIRQLARGKK